MDLRREIVRNAILAQSLEPLRKRPLPANLGNPAEPPKKPEYFIVAGVNSAWPFFDLADRVLQAGRQPECIFDIAYEAQKESTRGRGGGKVNQGPIQLLVPLITAQVLEYLETGTHEDVEAIVARTAVVLRATGEKDVECLEAFIRLGYEISARHRERHGSKRPIGAPTLSGRYPSVWDAARDFQHIHTVREMTQGYPYGQQVYRFLLHNVESGILPATELVARFLEPELQRPDVISDVLVVGLYLVLTKHPESVLFV